MDYREKKNVQKLRKIELARLIQEQSKDNVRDYKHQTKKLRHA